MNLKKFLAPNIAILIALSIFWVAGTDSVVQKGGDKQKNLQKYVEVQRRVIDNYVDKISINKMYRQSIKGLVAHLKDSTASLKGTPIDTTSFDSVDVNNLRQSYMHFENAYTYVENHFPNTDMDKHTADAIRSMFKLLDPHSIYISPKESKSVAEEFRGKFQGIGIQFSIIQDTITVVTPISGGPSAKLGIQSGDRIVQIGDSSAVGFTNDDVRHALRGPKGSKVKVTIKRPHVKRLLHFTITRANIPLYTVSTSYMLNKKTGYIKINRFAATTHQEFMEAMHKLQKKGMKRLILDLRGNPGGYLGQAIGVAEEFYPKGVELLSTKSRHPRFNSTYHSRRNGEFKNMPLMILVNQGSASASEIVTGAIQDHDRGLIVGRRTFGKGLVQQQYQLVDSSNIRITISRYYTPSGRLIQKPYSNKTHKQYDYEVYERKENAKQDVKQFLSNVPDSLKHYTDAGRPVYGGGGIIPDVIVQQDTSESAAVANFMQQKGVGLDFVRNYLDQQGSKFRKKWGSNYHKFRENFHWSNGDMNTLFTMLKKNDLAVSDTVSSPEFKSDTLYISPNYYKKGEWIIRALTKADLAEQVWGTKKYYPIVNDNLDHVLKKAMTLWPKYHQLEVYAANHTKPSQRADNSLLKKVVNN